MIYLDNAATGGFKPNSVIEKTVNVIKYLNANAGRSGHRLSKTAGELVFSCRKTLSSFFNNGDVCRVIFTKNCTEALNISILGTYEKGSRILTTCFEHNSVLRPLFTLEEKGEISLTVIYPENNEYITEKDIEKNFSNDVKTVIVNYASNVTGTVNDIKKIGDFLRDKNVTFIVDGAQAGGHIDIDLLRDGIDILCLAGHKGLYGIQGSGAIIFNKRTEIRPTFSGGTGTESFNKFQPDCYPEKLEAGTLNLPAICSLEEGVLYLKNSLEYTQKQLYLTTEYLINELTLINGVKVYSKPNPVGIVSFTVDGYSTDEVSDILSEKFNICVRSGFHCAPLMHKFLHTENDGLIRASISVNNYKRDLISLISAVKTLAK